MQAASIAKLHVEQDEVGLAEEIHDGDDVVVFELLDGLVLVLDGLAGEIGSCDGNDFASEELEMVRVVTS